jgi:uncharacterized protein (TIGR03435 family)
LRIMVRDLVKDRFGIISHIEKRELSAYTINVGKGGLGGILTRRAERVRCASMSDTIEYARKNYGQVSSRKYPAHRHELLLRWKFRFASTVAYVGRACRNR